MRDGSQSTGSRAADLRRDAGRRRGEDEFAPLRKLRRCAGATDPATVHPKGDAGPMAPRMVTRNSWAFRGLTFELSWSQRYDAQARVAKMYSVPPPGPAWHAVGSQLERGVRPRCAMVATALLEGRRSFIAMTDEQQAKTSFRFCKNRGGVRKPRTQRRYSRREARGPWLRGW